MVQKRMVRDWNSIPVSPVSYEFCYVTCTHAYIYVGSMCSVTPIVSWFITCVKDFQLEVPNKFIFEDDPPRVILRAAPEGAMSVQVTIDQASLVVLLAFP